MPDLLTAKDLRVQLAKNLRLARGTGSVHGAGLSGVNYRTVDRMESGKKVWVDLLSVYLLAQFYQVNLADLLRPRARGEPEPKSLGRWPKDAPSLTETDEHLRRRLRELRLACRLGTPALAERAGVHQSWIVRLEAGEVRADLIRVGLLAQALGFTTPDLLPLRFVHHLEIRPCPPLAP